MGDLSASISGRTLHELRIPGSHNSGSDVLGSSVAPGKPQVYAAVPCIIRGWSECQVECVLEQLRAGCRYIDLRTAAVKGMRGLRIVHGLVGRPVLEVLEQVSMFLAASPQEVVVLDFQHFYDVTQAEQATLLAQCLELFSAAGVIPPAKAKTATLAELWAAKTRVSPTPTPNQVMHLRHAREITTSTAARRAGDILSTKPAHLGREVWPSWWLGLAEPEP